MKSERYKRGCKDSSGGFATGILAFPSRGRCPEGADRAPAV